MTQQAPFGPQSPTSLDPIETTDDCEPGSHDSPSNSPLARLTFRHSGWADRRAKHRQALIDAGVSASRLERFDTCGSHPWVYVRDTPERQYRVAANKCHDRFCAPCTRERASQVKAHLLHFIQGRRPRFLTLTLKHSDEDLGQQLTTLWRSFRRLRNCTLWKSRVMGGAAFLEITWNEQRQEWHPHLHALIEGKYIPQADLAEAWKRASRGSWIVDIRDASNLPLTAHYVAAYATKSIAANCTRAGRKLAEAVSALEGRRSCVTFGKWRTLRLHDPKGEETWIPLAPLSEIRAKADEGNAWAILLLRHLQNPATVGPPPREHPPPIACGPESKSESLFSLAERRGSFGWKDIG